jgi:DNA-binding LacI/PurR family transcriptional regulator
VSSTGAIVATSTPPTLADVARVAGVSCATASRVLTGSARVRPETRRQVELAMADLGYVRNRAPRSGRTRTGSVAFVVCEENMRVFADPFFARMLWSVSRELVAVDMQLVLLTVHAPRDYRSVARYLRGGHVDGALFISVHGRLPAELDQVGVPIVLAGRPMDPCSGLSYVDADNMSGAERAVRYLLDQNRGCIATVAGPADMNAGVDRLAGYRTALAAAGISDDGLIAYGDFSRVSAEHATYRILDRRPGVDAVFAASDLMATGVLRALRRSGRRVPEDVAVVGFDDSPLAQHTEPQLTTVRQPIDAMGARMVAQLLALVSDPNRPASGIVLDTKLIPRDSA